MGGLLQLFSVKQTPAGNPLATSGCQEKMCNPQLVGEWLLHLKLP